MRINYIIITFLLFVQFSSPLQSNASTVNPQEAIKYLASQIAPKLPLLQDDETEFTSIEAGDMLLTYTYTWLSCKFSDPQVTIFKRVIRKIAQDKECLDMKAFFDEGVSGRYIYLSNDGKVLSDFYIHPSDCIPKNPSIHSEHVFKGVGFSFKYPADWEIGISQAESTEVLVRANSVQTGYSANCNINTGNVEGIEELSQSQVNEFNWKIHDLKYMSRIKNLFPDVQIINHNTHTYLSNQPASSIEFQTTIKGHNVSTRQTFFQIMTIRKPKRYVITCRSNMDNFDNISQDINMIIHSFLITADLNNSN